MTDIQRKPRIGLMGEFSAGKSTLSNFLLGGHLLPERVIATRLPPVWISEGEDAPYRDTMDGRRELVSLNALDAIPFEDTRAIRIFNNAAILKSCDLIDFPGISDPNMSAEVWERMVDEVDAVIWCTHATQAWRQSEAAVWQTIHPDVRERSVLLVTRFDTIASEADRARVLARLAKETRGLFAKIVPISLLEAIEAGENEEALEASGGLEFIEALIALSQSFGESRFANSKKAHEEEDTSNAESSEHGGFTSQATSFHGAQDTRNQHRIVPRRVRPAGSSARPARALPEAMPTHLDEEAATIAAECAGLIRGLS